MGFPKTCPFPGEMGSVGAQRPTSGTQQFALSLFSSFSFFLFLALLSLCSIYLFCLWLIPCDELCSWKAALWHFFSFVFLMITFPWRLLKRRRKWIKHVVPWQCHPATELDGQAEDLSMNLSSCTASFCVHTHAGACARAHTCTHMYTVLFRTGSVMIKALDPLAKRELSRNS